ncbi:MAG: PAS domain-containing protein [Pseudomonadota bacterium]|nr:PAS domain-containing protein [Pseudomonadota bacterium]
MTEDQREATAQPEGNRSSPQSTEPPATGADLPLARGPPAQAQPLGSPPEPLPPDLLPIIAIGTSAGGLEAASRLFDAISSAANDIDRAFLGNMAFLLVQHLDPTHPSLLADLLARHTAMPVVDASDNCPLAAGHVYVIPPGRYLSVRGATLHLTAPQARHGSRMQFDFLLKSLADGCGPQTLGVILSGMGTDGCLGLSALGRAGGCVIAQDPHEAEFDGMPRNAIATGDVDRILRLAEMPAAFADHARQLASGHRAVSSDGPARAQHPPAAEPMALIGDGGDAEALVAILSFLHEQTAQDFRQYKPGTILRRIERRMGLLGIHRSDFAVYLEGLRQNRAECDLLVKDLLINVTSFFRDPKVFEALDKTIIPGMIERFPAQQTLRIWVAGCSTGEEAYSLAMVCRDAIAAAGRAIKLQIFASDIDLDAVAIAREGLYPQDIAGTVPADRLARYFIKEDHGYRVVPDLRGLVVFTVQDVLSDPPFSRIDLVSCRNLLIYLNPEAQAKVIAFFHFALREGGILLLGSSETVGKSGTRFELITKSERFYRHVAKARPGESDIPFSFGETPPRLTMAGRDSSQARRSSLADICARAVLAGHAPAALLINRQRQVLYAMGPTNRYLQLAAGYASHDLLAMAAPALRRKLKLAIEQAIEVTSVPPGHGPGHGRGLPKSTRTRLTVDGKTIWFSIAVEQLVGDEDLLLVCFVDEPAGEVEAIAVPAHAPGGRVAELERELEAAQAELLVSIQNEETSHQEQKAINEEAMSVNEEFQSTNEELLTSKEELQSLNEELTALNSQLQETLDRQRLTSDDLQNVLYSTNIGTLFLDLELKIRFFTPAVSALFRIIPGDIGRPLSDLRSIAMNETLLSEAHEVASGAASTEREVAAPAGIWFLRRIFPYLTHDGRVEGVVITFADITQRKLTEVALEATKLEAERANLAKSRFLAAASHDLRQPLQSLTLLKELLVLAVEGDKPQKLLIRFEQTLRTISSMLNALLDINQIEAGVVQPKLVVFPLAELFDRMHDEFGYIAQARGLSLRVVRTSALVETDPRLLEQIIRNLIGNAIKYTEHGKIVLGVRHVGPCVRIAVGDTGIGIAKDQLQAIFEEFHQIGNEARERSRGLGLGLSIVQRLGHLLGHAIDVRSVPGTGSLFGVTVPLRNSVTETPALPLASMEPAKTVHPQHLQMLVVDDDPDILDLLELLLTSHGYVVSVASDAAAALALVADATIRPDILLTDYNLPGGINGLELVGKLRAVLDDDLPAIILTGDISTDTMAKIAVDDCIQMSKPVDPHTLLQAIERMSSVAAGLVR